MAHLLNAAVEPDVHEGAQAAQVHGTCCGDVQDEVYQVIECAVGPLLAPHCSHVQREIVVAEWLECILVSTILLMHTDGCWRKQCRQHKQA